MMTLDPPCESQQTGEMILSDVFVSHGNKSLYHVMLVRDLALLYRKLKDSGRQLDTNPSTMNENTPINLKDYSQYERLSFTDITGCQCMKDPAKPQLYESGEEGPPPPSNKAYFCIYAYPIRKKKKFGKGLKRQRVSLILMVSRSELLVENLALAEKWRDTIRQMLNGKFSIAGTPPSARPKEVPDTIPPTTSRKFLVFVSPKSGPGKALTIFKHRVLPMLAEASISYDLVITERQNAARDYVRTADLSKWHGIVLVSGDGLIYEVINGLMERPDCLRAIRTPIGVVPSGSGNGLAQSISHALREPSGTNSILLSAFNIIKARVVPMDLIRLQLSNSTMFSFLSVGWGIMADIDIESERLRSLGQTRFTLWAFHRIANLKTYKGRLSYLPIPGYEPMKATSKKKTAKESKTNGSAAEAGLLQRSISIYKAPTSSRPKLASAKSLPDNLDENTGNDSDGDPDECNDLELVERDDCNQTLSGVSATVAAAKDEIVDDSFEHTSLLEPLDRPVPGHWIKQEGDYVLVFVVYQSHIGTGTYGVPQATMDDGKMWMMIIRKGASRPQLVKFLLALESGNHIDLPFVDVIPIQAFRLEPLSHGGHLTVDGELVDYGPIQAEVLPSLARIMIHQ